MNIYAKTSRILHILQESLIFLYIYANSLNEMPKNRLLGLQLGFIYRTGTIDKSCNWCTKAEGAECGSKTFCLLPSRSDIYIVSMQQTTCSALLRGFEPCSVTESICTFARLSGHSQRSFKRARQWQDLAKFRLFQQSKFPHLRPIIILVSIYINILKDSSIYVSFSLTN